MAEHPIDDDADVAPRWLEAPLLDPDAARARRAVLSRAAGEYQTGAALRIAGSIAATCPRCHLTISVEGGWATLRRGLRLIDLHPSECDGPPR